MRKTILDCDPGIDDALAIILALNSDKIDLYGITTVHGNSPLSQTTLNARRILDYLKSDAPVAMGSSRPLKAKQISYEVENVHGKDGLGDSSLLPKTSRRPYGKNAVDFILEGIKSGVRTLVATGPLTNIALAFQKDSETMKKLEELVIMGGAIHVSGNIDFLSEFNFYADPHAADYILQNADVRKVLVPLDVTRQVILTPSIKRNISNSKTGKLAKSIVKKYQTSYVKRGFKGNPLHDPLALGYAIENKFLKLTPMNLRVESEGKYTRGECVPEQRPWANVEPNVYVATEVRSKDFLRYFQKTIGGET